jgi:hypothetical protein
MEHLIMQIHKPPLNIDSAYYIGRYAVNPVEPLGSGYKWLTYIHFSPRASGVLQCLDYRLLTTEPQSLTLRQAAAIFGVDTIRRKMQRRNPGQMSLPLAA